MSSTCSYKNECLLERSLRNSEVSLSNISGSELPLVASGLMPFKIKNRFLTALSVEIRSTGFSKREFNIEEDDIEVLENNAIVEEGDNDHYLAMIDFVENNSLATDTNFDYIKTQLDPENFQDYLNLIEKMLV